MLSEEEQPNQSFILQQSRLEQPKETHNIMLPQANNNQKLLPRNHRSIEQVSGERMNTKGVQESPEYYRINNQICNKLYEVYKKMKINLSPQAQMYTFEQRQQSNNTLNYHKIMQMFKDIDFKLQINQKLQILRSIKKFSFNQNYITQHEFIRIYKVIVHAIGVKEATFKALIQTKISALPKKDQTMQKKTVSIKLNKNFGKKIKTQATVIQSKLKSNEQLLKDYKTIGNLPKNYSKKLQTTASMIAQENKVLQSARRGQSRRRMMTDSNRYQLGANRGYLQRAIEKNKLGKLTWQNLFKMSEDNLHHNIIIPDFVQLGMVLTDLQI